MVAAPALSFPVNAAAPSAVPAELPCLLTYLAAVPDPRQARGRRHSLTAILSLVCAALLCGVHGYQAVAQWGRDYPAELMVALGFPGATPCGSTLHKVLKRLDWERFAVQLHAWAEALFATLTPAAADLPAYAISLDGKTLRGSRTQEADITHVLSVVSQQLGLTLVQAGVASAGAEPTAVAKVLEALILTGRVVTMDALHTQEAVAQAVLDAGGDYLMTVKGNQPYLRADLQALFGPEFAAEQDRRTVETEAHGHGRIERRRLVAISVTPELVDWPGAAQVFLVERRVTHPGRPEHKRHTRALVYGITSLPPDRADAATLLRLNRGHWSIENRSHWIRDVVFREDASQVASGKIAQVMSAFRGVALNLLRSAGVPNVAAATRRCAARPWEALALLGIKPEK